MSSDFQAPTKEEITDTLQNALIKVGLNGNIERVFDSTFETVYEVGVAQLDDGSRVVVKTKASYLGLEPAEISRDTEWKNLQLLSTIQSSLLPNPIAHNEDVIVMSEVSGIPLAKTPLEQVTANIFFNLGEIVREINAIDYTQATYLPIYRSSAEFIENKLSRTLNKRLALEVISQNDYDTITVELTRLARTLPASPLMLTWNDINAHNILVGDSKLSGLVDFEDMIVAPLSVQLDTGWLTAEQRASFAQGYGKEVYEQNYSQTLHNILRTVSSLNAIYLASQKNDADWLRKAISNLHQHLAVLNLQVHLPLPYPYDKHHRQSRRG